MRGSRSAKTNNMTTAKNRERVMLRIVLTTTTTAAATIVIVIAARQRMLLYPCVRSLSYIVLDVICGWPKSGATATKLPCR